MKKKVDPRVRELVESCVASRERAFFVLVGDRGREQVVNLHYLLSKVTSSKPSVLWCYKKELGFSSHKRKRQKQLQKKISRGVYDPNVDDPFELFVASTDIRYIYYKETQQILGQTFGMCILQDYEALTPNILCRTVETVKGGGLVCLLLHSFDSLKQLYNLAMDIHLRYRTEAFSHVHPRYTERFLLSLVSCRRCLILDDELNILPINGGPQQGPPEDVVLQQQQEQQELQQIKDKVQHAPPLDALVRLCATKDQANAVLAFLDCLCSCKSYRGRDKGQGRGSQVTLHAAAGYQTVALTAGRGRGKSAALGLAVAAAVALDVSSIFICAPSAENVQTLFEFIQKGLVAMGMREQFDFQATVETLGNSARGPTGADVSGAAASGLYQRQAVKAITKIEVYRHHRQLIQFIFPNEKDALMQAELLVVDEAASIPLPTVKKLLGPYIVLLSSTINGYEGTGRSLSLKLLADLRRGPKASGKETASLGCRQLKELSLSTPIRYAAGDAMEKWLHALLCLDATAAPQLDPAKAIPSAFSCSLYLVNRDALFSYHPASEAFLQRLQSLFVSSHYKNTPNDLQLLADAPAHLVFAFMETVQDEQDTLPDVYCAIQVAIEGALSQGSIREALGRGLRPAGDLLPWTLAQAFADEDVGLLTGARIVRIAVHPSLQRMGFGSAALQQLLDFFEGKGLSLQEPAEFAAFARRRAKQQQQQQNGETKQRVSRMDGDIEDLDAEAGMSETDGETEEGTEGDKTDTDEDESEAVNAEPLPSKLKKRQAKQAKETAKETSKETLAVSLREVKAEQLQPRATPPLLCPCSRSRPPFAIDYVGTSFGLTEQLFRFWSRKGFLPVYLRQQPSDVTGEHSCIMLRPAAEATPTAAATAADAAAGGDRHSRGLYGGIDKETEPARAADGTWVNLFAEDFRRRFVDLTGGPFREMPVALALAVASAGAKATQGEEIPSLPPLNAKTVFLFFTQHDLQRLQKYSQQLADLSLITDLIPLLCYLYFAKRLRPLHLSFLQEAALLGMGGQRRQPDSLAVEFSVPVHQILALFNKAMVKCHQHIHGLLEAEVASDFAAASTRRVAVKQGEAVGGAMGQAPLAEEQRADAANVVKQQKQQLKKITEALGPDALEKYAVDQFSQQDIEGATRGRQVSGSLSIKRKNKQPENEAAEGTRNGSHKPNGGNKKFKNKTF